jgi:hypothetical protein
VAIDAAGNAAAVWQADAAGTLTIRAAVSGPEGRWSAPFTLSAPGATNPRVAIANGEITAVWQRTVGSGSVIETTTWRVGSSPSAAQPLTQPGQNGNQPDVSVAPNGRAVAAWRASDGSHFLVFAAERAPGSGFEAPQALSQPRADSSGVRVAMDSTGTAVVVWIRPDQNDIVQSATRFAGGSWLPVANVSPPGGDSFDPQIALAAGRGVSTFVRSSGSQWVWSVADFLAKPPPQGFVSRAYISAFRKGPPAVRLQGVRTRLWAYFTFLVQPQRGRPITVTWYPPKGRPTAPTGKARSRVIEATVGGAVLTRGTWRATLRVGRVVVAQARVRIG